MGDSFWNQENHRAPKFSEVEYWKEDEGALVPAAEGVLTRTCAHVLACSAVWKGSSLFPNSLRAVTYEHAWGKRMNHLNFLFEK